MIYATRKIRTTGVDPNGEFFGIFETGALVNTLRITCPVSYNAAAGSPFEGQVDSNPRRITVKVWREGVGRDGSLDALPINLPYPDCSFSFQVRGDCPVTEAFFAPQECNFLIGVFDEAAYAPPTALSLQFQVTPILARL